VCRSVSQCVTVRCHVLQSELLHGAACIAGFVAVCCSVLQCVAVSGSVLQ